ncbi:hypothetical protein NE237_031036 [Protea cynaroides]|uniref:Retrotransposon Copia-like N-terminal domain-containing protein n=1 Tax=Protea cynaroides TaxID=273540 RepID=A0A9Q0GZ09_9MAGN|nr:hypothetical protein NE237_031036 [Protea cynaroides]
MASSDNTTASHDAPATQNIVPPDASVSQTELASTLNPSSPLIISNIASLLPIKLTSTNYLLWKSLFEPIFCGHKLMHLIDGTMPTPIAATSFCSFIRIHARTIALSLEELHNLLILEELALTDDPPDQSQALAAFDLRNLHMVEVFIQPVAVASHLVVGIIPTLLQQ